MFKWVAGLCAAIYVTLLVFGAPPEGEAIAAVVETHKIETAAEDKVVVVETVEAPAPAETVKLVETVKTAALQAATGTLATQTANVVEIKEAVVKVAAVVAQPKIVVPDPEPAETADNRGIGEIWRVTGSSVNLRSGATTQAAILGKTRRGDSAEVIELLDSGWARVYILESGQEAFMSAKFLKREAQ